MKVNILCPACGKSTDAGSATSCVRCGCDLSVLAAILEGAEWHLQMAARWIRDSEWAKAHGHAERSWELRQTHRAAEMGLLAALARREGEWVERWWRRVRLA